MHLEYLHITPLCRILLQKLTGLQLVRKFPAFHGIRRFITALTSVRHLSLSWASPIQSIYPHPTSWRSILILSTHLRLGLPRSPFLRFPHQDPIYPPLLTNIRHMPSPSHSSRFYNVLLRNEKCFLLGRCVVYLAVSNIPGIIIYEKHVKYNHLNVIYFIIVLLCKYTFLPATVNVLQTLLEAIL